MFDPEIVWNEAESIPYADRNPYVGPQQVAEGVFGRILTWLASRSLSLKLEGLAVMLVPINHRIAVGICCLLLVSSCKDTSDPGEFPWVISGEVVARDIRISIGGPPSIHVKEAPADECGIIFLVGPETAIWRRSNAGAVVSASVADLLVGTRVRVWARAVFDSCPGQAGAVIVEIAD